MSEDVPKPQELSYADWLLNIGTRMQGEDLAPDAQEFGQHLLDIASYLKQQDQALHMMTHLFNQKQAGPPAEAESEGYPAEAMHQDPKVALALADGEFLEAIALLSYRQHQSGKEKPEDCTVEALGRNIVMFLTSLRNSPELLGKFAASFNFYSTKVQERMTMGINALSDTIH